MTERQQKIEVMAEAIYTAQRAYPTWANLPTTSGWTVGEYSEGKEEFREYAEAALVALESLEAANE